MHGTAIRTIDQCRQLTIDGELSAEDLWILADWLNTNPECCDTWPGNELAPFLTNIFSNGSINLVKLKRFAKMLVAIERKVERVRCEEAVAEAVEKFSPVVCQLPSVRLTKSIQSLSQPGVFYTVDLAVATCTCPDWHKTRRHLPPLSLGRCCKHIATILSQCSPNGGWPCWQSAVIAECRDRNRGINPQDDWRVIKIRDSFVLFSIGRSDWINIYGIKEGGYIRFGYNIREKRWAYGDRPYLSRTIIEAVMASV